MAASRLLRLRLTRRNVLDSSVRRPHCPAVWAVMFAGVGLGEHLPVVNTALHPDVPTVIAEDSRRLLDFVAGFHGRSRRAPCTSLPDRTAMATATQVTVRVDYQSRIPRTVRRRLPASEGKPPPRAATRRAAQPSSSPASCAEGVTRRSTGLRLLRFGGCAPEFAREIPINERDPCGNEDRAQSPQERLRPDTCVAARSPAPVVHV